MVIIDMPMPKNCCNCTFAIADLINGIITLSCMTQTGRRMHAPGLINEKNRPEWCPLKEQEAVEPIKMQRMDGDFSFFVPYYLCGNCRYELVGKDVMFCSHCGQEVKWE